MGPSGVGVWTAPTLDPERDTMYVTTGTIGSAHTLSDAVVALRMSTVKSCGRSSSRRKIPGTPLATLPAARTVRIPAALISISRRPPSWCNFPTAARALAGQKSGVAYAIDPDRRDKSCGRLAPGKAEP